MDQHPSSRRQFLKTSALGGAAVGLGVASSGATASTQKAPVFRQSVRIHPDDLKFRGITAGAHGEVYLVGDRVLEGYDHEGHRIVEIELDRPGRCVAIRDDGALLVGFRDHVRVYHTSGERLTTYPSLGKQAGITGIATSGDNVFVADAGQKTVWRLDHTGAVVNKIQPGPNGFSTPRDFLSVSIGDDGLVHVNNPGRHRVEAYTFNGQRVATWGDHSRHIEGFGGCCNPVSRSAMSGGQIVTAERGQPRVKLYDKHGAFVTEVMGPEHFEESRAVAMNDQDPTCRTGGLDVATGADGMIWVLDRATSKVWGMEKG
ncbi:MAG: twin-arginine translocation signal domain-containing protein [Planctomycetota bacterium]|jgi:hypothetical protein